MIDYIDFEIKHLHTMDMREESKQEISGEGGADVLLDISTETRTAMLGDEVFCCFGLTQCGGIWALTSNLVKEHPVKFARAAKAFLTETAKKNYVYTFSNSDGFHTRFMRFLGFTAVDEFVESSGIMYQRHEVV